MAFLAGVHQSATPGQVGEGPDTQIVVIGDRNGFTIKDGESLNFLRVRSPSQGSNLLERVIYVALDRELKFGEK